MAERILLVASEPETEPVQTMLSGQGYDVTAVSGSVQDIDALARSVEADLVVVAVRDPADEPHGLELGCRLRQALEVPVVYIVDGWLKERWDRLLDVEPEGYIEEPVEPWNLQATVELALRRYRESVRLRHDSELYGILFRQNVAGVYRKTAGGILLNCNESFARMFGYDDPEEMEGQPAEILYASPEDREQFLEALRRKGSVEGYELPMRRKDGTPLWVLENAAIIRDPRTDTSVVVGTLLDITDRKTLEIRLQRQANEDPLTGLANRRALNARAQQALELAVRRGEIGALLFLDVIRFKAINDSLGHRAGDQVLVEVAKRIESTLRSSDVAARVGGDEFVVLLSDVGGRVGARTAGHRILNRFNEPIDAAGQSVDLALRIGVSLFPTHARSLDELIKYAGGVVSELKPGTEPVVAVSEPAGVVD